MNNDTSSHAKTCRQTNKGGTMRDILIIPAEQKIIDS